MTLVYRRGWGALIGLSAIALLLLPSQRGSRAPTGVPLTGAQFTLVAQPGFGDYQNSWAWSSAWFKGRVYIGTGRNVFCNDAAKGKYPPRDPQLHCPTPVSTLPSTMGAQIWSVDPASSGTQALTQTNWVENYTSPITVPMVYARKHVLGPRDTAFRGMSLYTSPDNVQTLYASGLGYGLPNMPPSLLATTDGTTYQAVPASPGTTMGNITVLTTTFALNIGFRAQAQLGTTLYVVVTGGSGTGSVLASSTPSLGDNTFQQITPKTMGVREVIAFQGHVYLGLETSQGYSVVRTDCTAPPPGKHACPASAFTTVIPPGAGMTPNLNHYVESMAVYTDTAGIGHLYVGAGVTATHTTHGAELSRINPDDSWDVIAGLPRTVNGVMKQPLSGLGEGFGFPLNTYILKMAVYNGVLYVGTYNMATLQYINTPQWAQKQAVIGCNLWASGDGLSFQAVTRNGFGDPYCDGIRALTSTPYGLFVGGINDWHGLEVWQGIATNSTPTTTPTVATTSTPTSVATSTPTDTATTPPTSVATSTPTDTATTPPTLTTTTPPTSVASSTPTDLPISTPTDTATTTPTLTITTPPTSVASSTPTDPPISTPTDTATTTPTLTITTTPTSVASSTPTDLPISTPTDTATTTPP